MIIIIIIIVTTQMTAIADVTAQSLTGEIDNDKNPLILQPSKDKELNIHEHPFMKEVSVIKYFLTKIQSISFSLLQVV